MCFVFIWEQTATCAVYSINWLVFIAEMKSVYSAVRTGSLYIIQSSGGWPSAFRWRSQGLTQFSTCGNCGEQWAQKQVSLTVFLFPLVVIMPAMIHTHLHSHSAPTATYILQVYSQHSKSGSRWMWCQLALHSGVSWHYTVWSIALRCRSTHPHAHCTRLSHPLYGLPNPSGPAKYIYIYIVYYCYYYYCRSQWPRGLRRSSAAASLLRLWVRIPPGDMDVCLLWMLCIVR